MAYAGKLMLKFSFLLMLTEKFPQLMELFHLLNIWHKAKKLNKAIHQVTSVGSFENAQLFVLIVHLQSNQTGHRGP